MAGRNFFLWRMTFFYCVGSSGSFKQNGTSHFCGYSQPKISATWFAILFSWIYCLLGYCCYNWSFYSKALSDSRGYSWDEARLGLIYLFLWKKLWWLDVHLWNVLITLLSSEMLWMTFLVCHRKISRICFVLWRLWLWNSLAIHFLPKLYNVNSSLFSVKLFTSWFPTFEM